MKWSQIYTCIEKMMLVLTILGVLGFILHVFMKVRDGHGLDYYISGTGYQLNYIGVLILFSIIPIALGGGWILGRFLIWYDKKQKIKVRKLKWEKIKQFNQTKKRERIKSLKKRDNN